jgi:hypothetical protein
MTVLRFLPATFAASAVLLLASLSPTSAHALQACEATADCEKGFECTIVGTSGCAPAACAPGTDCKPAPCETVVEKACTPAHCQADADCASGMVCHGFTQPCAVSNCACPPDATDCGCATPVCDPQIEMICTPRYALPCATASDCGDGFTCEEQLSCSCSGSDGGATPTPGAAPRPEGAAGAPAGDAALPRPNDVPECSCQPSGISACVAQEIPCAAPTDCPTGWSCHEAPLAGAPDCDGGDCGSSYPLVALPRVCRPDYYSTPVDGGDSGEQPTTPEGGPTKGEPGTDNGGTEPPMAGSGEESNESAACQMGHAPASSGVLSLLVMLGALLGLKRRRA